MVAEAEGMAAGTAKSSTVLEDGKGMAVDEAAGPIGVGAVAEVVSGAGINCQQKKRRAGETKIFVSTVESPATSAQTVRAPSTPSRQSMRKSTRPPGSARAGRTMTMTVGVISGQKTSGPTDYCLPVGW